MQQARRWRGAAMMLVLFLAACGGNTSGQINAPSTAASANNATDRESGPGSGTGDGTGSDATTTASETDQATTATDTSGAAQGDPNVMVLTIGVAPDQALFTQGVATAPANRELEIVFSNPSQQPHNWVLVQPGQEQAVVDAAANGTDPGQIEGVIAWGETVTSADTRIKVPRLPLGSYPYISTVPGDFPNMKGALDVTTGSN